jgi:hypothetical protein
MGVTINPAVNGVSYRRWSLYVALYGTGVFVGAAASYVLATAIETTAMAVIGRPAVVVAVVVAVTVAVVRDGGVPIRMPYREQTQVSERVRNRFPLSVTSLIYGSHLGVGFLTRYTYSTHLAFVLLLPLVFSPAAAMGVIVVHAAAKTYPLIAAAEGGTYQSFERSNLARFRTRRIGWVALRLVNAAVSSAAVFILASSI